MDSVSFVSENIVSGQKLCSFLLPTAWTVPECLKRTSPKEMGAVLDIAANVWERILHGAESVHMKDVLESERLRLVEEWSMKLDVVEKRSVLEKQCLDEKWKLELGKLERRISDLQGQLVGSEASCGVLRQQYEGLKVAISESFHSALETVKVGHVEEVERIRGEYKERLAEVKAEVEREWTVLRGEQEKLRKSASSAKKGALGEQGIREFIEGYTGWTIAEDSSKTAQATDCVVMIEGVECRFEVKNYSNVVPLKEVTKFGRDMQAHPESKMGVFLSLNTAISGRKGDGILRVEWSPLGQLLVFIQKFCEQDPVAIASFLENCVGIYKHVEKIVGEGGGRESGEIEDHYKGILGQIGVYLEKELVRVGELGLCVGHDKKNLLDLIQKQYANYTYQFGQLKGALETLVMIVSGKDFVEETKDSGEIVGGSGGDALLESGGEIVDILLPNKKKGKKKAEGASV